MPVKDKFRANEEGQLQNRTISGPVAEAGREDRGTRVGSSV